MRPARHPDEMELQIALDVVHSLGRVYAAAVAAFRYAVGMGAGDMRAWNKLGRCWRAEANRTTCYTYTRWLWISARCTLARG